MFYVFVRVYLGKVNWVECDCDVIYIVVIFIFNFFVVFLVDFWDLVCRWECEEKWNFVIDFNIVVILWFKVIVNKVCLIINDIILWKELIL